jgi:azurin
MKLKTILVAGIMMLSAISFSGQAIAKDNKVTVNVSSMGEQMMYNMKDISVPADSTVTVIFQNKSSSLKHNWVLTQKGASDKVAMEGMSAGESKGYVTKSDKIIAFTKLSEPGKKVQVTFKAPKKGTYDYVCTSPGHNAIMKGKFVVK